MQPSRVIRMKPPPKKGQMAAGVYNILTNSQLAANSAQGLPLHSTTQSFTIVVASQSPTLKYEFTTPDTANPGEVKAETLQLECLYSTEEHQKTTRPKDCSIAPDDSDKDCKPTRFTSTDDDNDNGNDNDNDGDDDGDDNKAKKQCHNICGDIKPQDLKSDDGQGKLFACPFLKLSPFVHQECRNLKLKRIKDVKQHLSRRHIQKGEFDCQHCHTSFSSSEEREQHAQSTKCHDQKSNNIGQLPPQAKHHLTSRSKRKLRRKEQWYELWDRLFTTYPRPSSPFLDMDRKIELEALQSLLTDQSSHIIPDFLQSRENKIWTSEAAMSQLLIDFVQSFPTFLQQQGNGNTKRPPTTPPSTPLIPVDQLSDQMQDISLSNLLGADDFDINNISTMDEDTFKRERYAQGGASRDASDCLMGVGANFDAEPSSVTNHDFFHTDQEYAFHKCQD